MAVVTGRPDLARRALAEALAAFALVFAGCGAIVANTVHPGALGAALGALAYQLVRGEHPRPATLTERA